MTDWLLAPLAMSGVLGLLAPRIALRLPPAFATWILSGGAVVAAAASSVSVGLLALLFVAPTPLLDAQEHWSGHVLRLDAGQAPIVGASATAAVIVLAVRFVRVAARRLRAIRDAFRLSAALATDDDELVVVPAADCSGFAVPGRPGRIVVSAGLLRTLDADERRAVLAHERAHLAHHHYLHQSAAALAAALNPMLGALPRAVELSCERWADESAAQLVRRNRVAHALARVATSARGTGSSVVLAVARSDLAVRIGALRAPAPRLVPWRIAVLVLLLAATLVAVAVALQDTDRVLDLAQLAYQRAHR